MNRGDSVVLPRVASPGRHKSGGHDGKVLEFDSSKSMRGPGAIFSGGSPTKANLKIVWETFAVCFPNRGRFFIT